jgi:SAM-dependent methyltransferase
MSLLPLYDTIGIGYNSRRAADGRIVARLVDLLQQTGPAMILDVGAGTGNYAAALASLGYKMYAIEPSKLMVENAIEDESIQWHLGNAEDLPFDEDLFDAAYCTLSLHHFSNLDRGLREIHRVLKPGGRFVAFTSDPRRVPLEFWMRAYFGDLCTQAEKVFPATDDLLRLLGDIGYETPQSQPYPIPAKNADGFFCSAWQRPQEYLDDEYRRGISSFQLTDATTLNAAVARLKADLQSGQWDASYGWIRNESDDGGYMFVSANKAMH